MHTIFDFGMYDASDTEYYLHEGYTVVAVEANPALVQRAQSMLASYVKSGQLTLVNAGISGNNENVTLTISGDDLGSSSIYQVEIQDKAPVASFTVPGITTQEIFERFGVPFYLKVDIEGADRLSVLALTPNTKPEYVSFEIGKDLEELLHHLESIGFSRYQSVNQCNFRELSVEDSFRDRVALKLVRMLGYAEPRYTQRSGRYFKLGHSSGPGPWSYTKGWRTLDAFLRQWSQPKESDTRNVWYDLLAK